MNPFEKYLFQYFNIDAEQSSQILSYFKQEIIKKGDYFVESGSLCNRLSFIQEGMLRVYANLPDREITQWISTNGFITDVHSFFYRQPTLKEYQALTDLHLLTINYEDYLDLKTSLPIWTVFERELIGKCFLFMETRVFDLISMSAEERYKSLFDQNRELFNQVPLQYIASMLGMTPETFSRIRRKKT